MRYIENSQSLIIGEQSETQMNLFIQFFIHPNPERYNEIKTCLKFNAMNPNIKYIYLLNEYQPDGTYRPFTEEELGFYSEKFIQIPLGHRFEYSDAFKFAKELNCEGYNIIANADIFFDDSLENVLRSNMNERPIMMCQLRYEFDGTPRGIKIFGPRADSQDAWIWHSKWNDKLQNKVFKFQLGQAGCDNHITYLFKIMGFELVNDPQLVHCLHYHNTQIRDYKKKDMIKSPYMLLTPKDAFIDKKKDVKFEDNESIYNYIREIGNKPFVIPRVAGIENISAYNILYRDLPVRYDVMKNNAGVKITSKTSMIKYAKEYYDAFENCQIYTGWSKDGEDNVYGGLNVSQDIIQDDKYKNRIKVWAHCLDIFEYINYTPWTLAMEGKRILIISSFIESFKKKLPVLDKIYGREIFKNNTFVFVKPPMLNGDSISQEWNIELNKFSIELDKLRDDYDIALVSCGGLGNAVCNHIFKSGKQAIYVGGTLQMYFGVYGNRWLQERPAIMRMYLNEHWSRPMDSERPEGHHKVEGGCYF
jgi:hypothetical protein